VKAIQFDAAIPRYGLGLALSKIYEPVLWSGLSCLRYRDIPEPRLPNEEWVIVKTRYGGICGSDTHLIHLGNSPSGSALASFPFIIGHENCGTIAFKGKAVSGFTIGDRVVVEPTLSCVVRGFKNLCKFCTNGEPQRCERVTQGTISAGLLTGTCRDTGGSWSPFFLAHRSQLFHVPDQIDDQSALMIEPFAVSLHAVLCNLPSDDETVLIIGAGAIGLLVLAALRAVGSKARIIALARYPFQQEMARKLGANEVISASRGSDYDEEYAKLVNGRLLKPILGKRVVVGGSETVFECVGSSNSIDDALRFARGGGRVVLAGLASIPRNVDWTPIWMKELQMAGTYIYGNDYFQGKRWRTFDLAIDLVTKGKVELSPFVTHKFELRDYSSAFEMGNNRNTTGVIKAAFDFA
jgi:L-iditol 2-dehydrogenase